MRSAAGGGRPVPVRGWATPRGGGWVGATPGRPVAVVGRRALGGRMTVTVTMAVAVLVIGAVLRVVPGLMRAARERFVVEGPDFVLSAEGVGVGHGHQLLPVFPNLSVRPFDSHRLSGFSHDGSFTARRRLDEQEFPGGAA